MVIRTCDGSLYEGTFLFEAEGLPVILLANGVKVRGDLVTAPTAHFNSASWTVGFPDLLIRYIFADTEDEAIEYARLTPEYQAAHIPA